MMADTSSSLARAFAHHQAGRLAEAGMLYRAILGTDPNHPDALHLLGLVERRTGSLEQAITLVARAVALRGDFTPALTNLADMLQAAGRHGEAAACLARLADLEPATPATRHALARALHAAGRIEEAITVYRQAVALKPDAIDVQLGLIALLHGQNRPDEAAAVFAEYRRRVPGALRPFQHIEARRWCHPVDGPAAMLASPDTLWVAKAGEERPLGPPDYFLDDDDLTCPGFAEGLTVDMRHHTLRVGASFIAHLRDVTIELVSRVHGLRGTFNLFVSPDLALADAYHDWATTERLLRFTGETAIAEVQGQRIPLDVRIAAEPDQVVTEPALLVASRYIHHNYFHWMFEGVTRLWCLEELPGAADIPLLMPAGAVRPYHRDVLDALRVRNRIIPLTGTMVRAEQLYFPSLLGPGTYAAPQIEWLRRRLLPAFGVQPWPAGGRRLYLSRADAGVRSLVNEEAMVAMLRDRGFEVVVPGRMSVAEQIRTFAEAMMVVAPHGAGNTNMVFAPPGATLIELVPQSTRALLYWMTAKQAGQRYGRILCPEDPATGRLVVDPARLAALLDQTRR